MASLGSDQFWADAKLEDNTVTPKKKKISSYSQVSSMSSPQGTSVSRTNAVSSSGMSDAARRRLKKMQQQGLDS